MSFLLFLLVFSGGGALAGRVFHRRFSQGAPVFVLAAVAILYVFALFGGLLAGVWVVLGLAAAGLVWLAVDALRRKTLAPVKELLSDPGFFALAVLLAAVFLINQNRNFIWSDEFTFWGLAAKETVRQNAMYNLPGSAIISHRDYPPALSLFEYFWCRLAGGYSEVSVYRALQFFSLSMCLPVFTRVRWRRWPLVLGLTGLVLVFHTVAMANLYASVYIDAAMGVLVGAAFAVALLEDKPTPFTLVWLGLGCFVATLSKSMGVFALVFVALYLLVVFFAALQDNRRTLGARRPWQAARPLLPVLAVSAGGTILAKVSWSAFCGSIGVTGATFPLDAITPASVLAAFTGRGTPLQTETVRNFSATVLQEPILNTPFAAPFFQTVLLLGLVCVVGWLLSRGRPHARQALGLAVAVPAGLALYAVGMLALYLFSFGADEGSGLASYSRYMSTGVIAALTAMLLAYTEWTLPESDRNDKKLPILRQPYAKWCIAIVLVLALMVPTHVYTSLLPYRRDDDTYSPNAPTAEGIAAHVDTETGKLYVVLQGAPGATMIALRYYASPLEMNDGGTLLSLEAPEEGEAVSGLLVASPAQWMEKLADEGYTHVFVGNATQGFIRDYSGVFAGGEGEIFTGGLYRVAGGGLELVDTVEQPAP